MGKKRKGCKECGHRGWAIFDSDSRGLEIEKCDTCDTFGSDYEATDHGMRAILSAMKAAHESLTTCVAEGCDKFDPEGVSHALSSLAYILSDQYELEAKERNGSEQ